MSPGFYDINGQKVWKDPYIDGLSPVTACKIGVGLDLVKRISKSYRTYLKEKAKFVKLKPLNKHQTVNGIPGSRFINRINISTSAGYPFNRPKKEFLVEGYSYDGEPDAVMFEQKFFDEMQRIISCYRKGVRYNPIFVASLKDEPVKGSKKYRTRIFASCPLAFNLLLRKYFLPIIDFVQSRHFRFNSAVGVNARSKAWGLFASYLCYANIIAGDYEAFDKNPDALMLLLAYSHIIFIAQECGYSDDDIKIMWGLAIDAIYCTYSVLGNLILTNGSTPSGKSTTILVNNFLNLNYTSAAFGSVYPLSKFWDIPKLFYGDDNIISVPPWFPKYTHTHIMKSLAKIGIKYTMADKEAESVPYITLEEADFLKRKFFKDGTSCLAPLAVTSIFKSLCYRTQLSEGVSELQRNFDALTNAKVEAMMHIPQDNGTLFHCVDELQKQLVLEKGLDWKVLSASEIADEYYAY
jgi:hypothetical protein